ncbi:carbohydrate porin, partial [Klebsiella michiganensis]|uniref:carbohydrate porin n=1 Tax=Klebsiella michiganensis TaxID=1134687 RepID=UPI001CE3A159
FIWFVVCMYFLFFFIFFFPAKGGIRDGQGFRWLGEWYKGQGKDNTDNRKNYGAIVRPMYFWNDVHSTWLEAGYQRVDYDQGGDNHGWKLTLSQNIAIGMGPEFRPMLRFYVTGGQVDNKRTAKVNGTKDEQLDSLNVGGMFEAWF